MQQTKAMAALADGTATVVSLKEKTADLDTVHRTEDDHERQPSLG